MLFDDAAGQDKLAVCYDPGEVIQEDIFGFAIRKDSKSALTPSGSHVHAGRKWGSFDQSKTYHDPHFHRHKQCICRSGARPSPLDWSQCGSVERKPGKVSGIWVFKGTRVPVRALFENLEGGARVEDFLDWFPGVSRVQLLAVLRHAER